MIASKWLRFLALAATIGSCIGTIVSAYRQDAVVVNWYLRIARVPGPSAVECQLQRTLRVINVRKGDLLNLRAQPSAHAAILIGIPPDTRGLTDLGEHKNAFRLIEFLSAAGYVHEAFVATDIIVCLPKLKPATPRPQDTLSASCPCTRA